MLLISRKDICLRTLPIPDFKGFTCGTVSSEVILCVRGLGLGRAGVIAPALKLRSDRKDSLSEANFSSALSKSKSPRKEVLLGDELPLIVTLLRLLCVPFESDPVDRIDIRASLESFDKRCTEFRLPFCESGLGESANMTEAVSSSASASSSIVSVREGPGALVLCKWLYSSPSFKKASSISDPSTPAIQKKSARGAVDVSGVEVRGISTIWRQRAFLKAWTRRYH